MTTVEILTPRHDPFDVDEDEGRWRKKHVYDSIRHHKKPYHNSGWTRFYKARWEICEDEFVPWTHCAACGFRITKFMWARQLKAAIEEFQENDTWGIT